MFSIQHVDHVLSKVKERGEKGNYYQGFFDPGPLDAAELQNIKW